ncbi:MAG: hypothetical protein ACFB4J_02365 [Elainellaceae cyanobacterium]
MGWQCARPIVFGGACPQTIEVHRSQGKGVILGNGDRFTAPELLPGWEMEVSSIWAPEFD